MLDSLNTYAYFPTLNLLVAYQEEKLNFLTLSRRRINSPTYDNSGKLNITDKLFYYDRLLADYNKLDAMLQNLEAYSRLDNYTDFLAMNFESKKEFDEYISDEKLENGLEISGALKNLQQYYLKGENNIRRTNYVTYRKQQIPLFLGNGFYRSVQPQTYITKCIETTENGVFLGGSSISKDGFATAYIALCSADTSNVVWLKTVDIGRMMYDNCVTALCPTLDGGCFALIVAKNVSDPELINSTVIQYNAKGTEVKRITLPEKTLGIGRYISYDDVNEQLLMAFYGVDEFWFSPGGKLFVQKINLNNEILMKAELQLDGELVDIISVKDNALLLIGNYYAIIDETGKEYKQESANESLQSAVFSALLGSDGKLKKINHYVLEAGSGIAVKSVKISNSLINILGQKSLARKDTAVPFREGDLVYLMVDNDGKLIYSNQKMK